MQNDPYYSDTTEKATGFTNPYLNYYPPPPPPKKHGIYWLTIVNTDKLNWKCYKSF
jgi:hypothetical protein